MDEQRLLELEAQASGFEAALLNGTFDPGRVPVLPTRSFAVGGGYVAAAGPDASYGVLAPTLAGATRTLDIYIYNLTGQQIADVILDRLHAGVAVRLMYDVNDTRGGEAQRIDALRAAGAQVRKAPSSGPGSVFTVCHQKLCVADGLRTCLGSANWGPSGFPDPVPARFNRCNREWVLAVDDEGLGGWWTELFEADWELAGRVAPADAGIAFDAEMPDVLRPAAHGVPPGPFPAFRGGAGEVRMTPIPSPDSYMPRVGALIDGARRRILVQQQYILLSGPAVRDLLGRVRARAEAGVEVRVIVSPQFRKVGATDNWELTQRALAAYGLEDRLRAMNIDVFSHLHNKGLVVDDSVVVSSTNWSDNSLTRGREAGLVVEDGDLADYFAGIFDADWGLAWPSADVRPNMAELLLDAALTPGGLLAAPAADYL